MSPGVPQLLTQRLCRTSVTLVGDRLLLCPDRFHFAVACSAHFGDIADIMGAEWLVISLRTQPLTGTQELLSFMLVFHTRLTAPVFL